MTPPKKILFLTNSDYGQANVVLATAYNLLHTAPDVEIHIASFQALHSPTLSTSKFAIDNAPKGTSPKGLKFHALKGSSWGEVAFGPETGYSAVNDLKPGLRNSAKCVSLIPTVMLPWKPSEFLVIYREAERVMKETEPNLTIVEPLFTPGLTLCYHTNTNWAVLAPNTIKDFVVPLQPSLAMFWKYPLVSSALPFPIPWPLIPRNIALTLVAGYTLLMDNRIKNVTNLLREKVSPSIVLITANELGVLKSPPPGLRILVANSPDIDYPFKVLPPHLIPTGPIVRAAPPVSIVDPALEEWLGRRETVYVNLGTHLEASPGEAVEMAHALKSVLDRAATLERKGRKALQILWKLGRKPVVDGLKSEKDVYDGPWKPVVDVLHSELEEDTVRVTDWVTCEPKSVLESGHVICAVHHGGASSFYESICAGIPQVVLPPWTDCYDFANRVELLGVGRWANKNAKPRWERIELASSLYEVLFGSSSETILAKAREIASRHPEEAGRGKAAREILGFLN